MRSSCARWASLRLRADAITSFIRSLPARTSSWRARKAQYSDVIGHDFFGSNAQASQ
jgi:hypothetical protein